MSRKYQNYASNLEALKDVEFLFADEASMDDRTRSFVLSGTVSKFSVQMELAWKMLAELLEDKEWVSAELVKSPRGTIKEAQATYGDDFDGDLWIEMLGARNNIVHTYGDERVQKVVETIRAKYIPAFVALQTYLVARYGIETLHACD